MGRAYWLLIFATVSLLGFTWLGHRRRVVETHGVDQAIHTARALGALLAPGRPLTLDVSAASSDRPGPVGDLWDVTCLDRDRKEAAHLILDETTGALLYLSRHPQAGGSTASALTPAEAESVARRWGRALGLSARGADLRVACPPDHPDPDVWRVVLESDDGQLVAVVIQITTGDLGSVFTADLSPNAFGPLPSAVRHRWRRQFLDHFRGRQDRPVSAAYGR